MNTPLLILIDEMINSNLKNYFLFKGGDQHPAYFSSIVLIV